MATNPVILRNAVDTGTWSKYPTANYVNATRAGIGNGSGNVSEYYLYFAIPFPKGATLINATLTLTSQYSYSGGVTHTVTRCASGWNASKLTYNNKPAVTGAAVSVAKTSPAAATKWAFNVTAQLQTVSNGAAWYGFKVVTNATAYNYIWTAQAPTVDYRPVLSVSWSDAPKTPTLLYPAGGRAVGIPKPVLQCNFVDVSGDTTMQAIQVQIDSSGVFTTPQFDSGVVATSEPELDLATTAFAGLINGDATYWRARVQDGAGLWSGWSTASPFTYQSKGTLTLNNPALLETRRNMVKNPSWRATSGTREVRRNVAQNASSETATAWASNNGSVYPTVIDNTKARSGTQSTRSDPVTGQGVLASMYNVGGNPMPVSAGEYVTGSVYVAHNAPVNATATLTISWLDASNVQQSQSIGTAVTTVAGDGLFTSRPSASGLNPGGTVTQFRLLLTISRNSGNVATTAEKAWADDACIEKATGAAPAVMPFFYGASPAFDGLTCSFVGTANASDSIATGPDFGSTGTGFTFYGGTPQIVGWQSSAGVMKILNKITQTFSLWAFMANSPVVAAAGQYWSGRFQVRSTNGNVVTIISRLGCYNGAGANISSDQGAPPTTAVPADGSWVDVAIPSLNPCPATTATCRFLIYGSGSITGGSALEFRFADLENVGATAVTVGPYMDGSFTGDATTQYSWASTTDASESIQKKSAVAEATPPIDWTFTGRTQKAYQILIADSVKPEKTLWTTGKITSTVTVYTIPANVLKTNDKTYVITLRIWDTVDRENTPGSPIYAEVVRGFIYSYDQSIDGVTGLVATTHSVYPWVQLSWQRSTMPDKWNVYRNNKLVKVYTGDQVATSPGNYAMWDYMVEPRKNNTWYVVAVVNGKGSLVNPTVTYQIRAISVVLTDQDGSHPVVILNKDIDMALQETSAVYTPAGDGAPILITQAERGYQGSVKGRLASVGNVSAATFKANYKELIKYNGQTLILTNGDDSFECFIYAATYKPVVFNEEVVYDVSFNFFQTDYAP